MPTIFEDLHLIARRPGMYIGSNRVSDLMVFVHGYKMAISGEEGKRFHTENGLPLQYLTFHLAKKYRKPAPMGWAKILAEVAGGEEAGLKLFFRELEEFEAITLEKVRRLVLTPEMIRYNREEPTVPRVAHDGGPWIPRYSDVGALYKVTLSNGQELLAVEAKEDGQPRVEIDHLVMWRVSIDGGLEGCFGSLVWEDVREEFLDNKILIV